MMHKLAMYWYPQFNSIPVNIAKEFIIYSQLTPFFVKYLSFYDELAHLRLFSLRDYLQIADTKLACILIEG